MSFANHFKSDELQPDRTFTLFPNLPVELQCKIWRRKYPGPRVVVVLYTGDHAVQGTNELITSWSPPITFQVCQQSRVEAQKTFKLLLDFNIPRTSLNTYCHGNDQSIFS